MEQLNLSIENLLKQFKLHPTIALILFPLLTQQPEEYAVSLKEQVPKFLPETPDYVMDQKIYLQQFADSVEYLSKSNLGNLIDSELKIRKLAAKASLSLMKDDKYKDIISQPEEFLQKIFTEIDLQPEYINGVVQNEVMWNGKPKLEMIDTILAFIGVVLVGVWFLQKYGVIDQLMNIQ
ncbi:hypothetical protein SS50377_26399 [Spironucleus salmonicida]|uniref:Uncharacterized protein n=1 Tax=Spironucleus salmonicida TaxID=348837 RepID=V6LT33_9EUKA|nr:hypothetical protein SS50377_26399 [Spironucleus salmonicida]|eukprot:EST47735.1 Hypothetical protein SS50377_12132 [Spironucleus salmonicida]